MADTRISTPAPGTLGTTPATSHTTTSPQPMRVFTTETALVLLWKKASPELRTHELEWFASGAAEQVARDAVNLSSVLEETACLVSNGKGDGFQDSCSTSNLLFNLKSQLDTLAGLADIANEANSMVRSALKDGAE